MERGWKALEEATRNVKLLAEWQQGKANEQSVRRNLLERFLVLGGMRFLALSCDDRIAAEETPDAQIVVTDMSIPHGRVLPRNRFRTGCETATELCLHPGR